MRKLLFNLLSFAFGYLCAVIFTAPTTFALALALGYALDWFGVGLTAEPAYFATLVTVVGYAAISLGYMIQGDKE